MKASIDAPVKAKINNTVLFGVTGDLARAKLIPSLARLWKDVFFVCTDGGVGALTSGSVGDDRVSAVNTSPNFIGFGRKDFSKEDFEKYIGEYSGLEASLRDEFVKRWNYVCSDLDDEKGYEKIGAMLAGESALFYVALPPQYQMTVAKRLVGAGLLSKNSENSEPSNISNASDVGSTDRSYTNSIAFEKPFGHSSDSALELNGFLLKNMNEGQVLRVDHYAGKEAILDIEESGRLGLLNKTLNSENISKIEIHLHEQKGAQGRGAFYDAVGALYDVGQNHILHALATVLVAPFLVGDIFVPVNISLKKMRHIALESVDFDISQNGVDLGQYNGFLNEAGVGPNSQTETYFKIKGVVQDKIEATVEVTEVFKKAFIERWGGLQIEISAGKAMKENDVAIYFYNKCASAMKSMMECEPSVSMIPINGHRAVGVNEAYDEIFRSALSGATERFVDIEQVLIGWQLTEAVKDMSKKTGKKPFTY